MRTLLAAIVIALLGGVAMLPTADRAGSGEVVFQILTDAERKGRILCGLYHDESTWLTHQTFRDGETTAGSAWVTCVFAGVPNGTYAIAALHDENGNGDMDKNFIGMPEEGYAASRDAHLQGIGAPDWEDAAFRHQGARTLQRARMKY